MILPDVNILIHAHRRDAPDHARFESWLASVTDSHVAFGLCDAVLAGFLRIVTNPRAYQDPTPITIAVRFADELLSKENCVLVRPAGRHWSIFIDLCNQLGARGNLVSDAYLAALAIESGCEFITTDRDFARFPGLRWRHPLK